MGIGVSLHFFCPPCSRPFVIPANPHSMSTAKTTYMFVFRSPAEMPDASPAEMQQSFQKWMAWIHAMKARGQYLAGEPLEDTQARVLRGPRGGKVTDGPFV